MTSLANVVTVLLEELADELAESAAKAARINVTLPLKKVADARGRIERAEELIREAAIESMARDATQGGTR